jgi:L-rhamnose mutarotase
MKILFLFLLLAAPLLAFSPYESYLASDKPTHVGLLAEIAPGQAEALADLLQTLDKGKRTKVLRKAGIQHVSGFTRSIRGIDYAILYFTFDGTLPYLSAAERFEKASSQCIDWKGLVEPHPRALRYGRHWLQLEWINFIAGVETDGEPKDKLMIGCRIRPEKEAEYRTLHQTVWPGVVDQVVRGNIRNLNIFMVELGEDLVEFLYLEYMGNNRAEDDAANAADPINQRWWKHTDACQLPLPDVTEGIWTELEQLD